MGRKIRFLLTNKCTAHCAYCHNEGQGEHGNLLSLAVIDDVLRTLDEHGCPPSEIVLSGGEPTLHKNLAEIAQRCKATGAHLSMNSHAGHPRLLARALPYLDELKVHVDSFDALEQRQRMGIEIDAVLESIRQARQFPIRMLVNHPLACKQALARFISDAREVGIDCKIIEKVPCQPGHVALHEIDWQALGYQQDENDDWQHQSSQHQVFTKQCMPEHDDEYSLFIGPDGIRTGLHRPSLGRPEHFSITMTRQ